MCKFFMFRFFPRLDFPKRYRKKVSFQKKNLENLIHKELFGVSGDLKYDQKCIPAILFFLKKTQISEALFKSPKTYVTSKSHKYFTKKTLKECRTFKMFIQIWLQRGTDFNFPLECILVMFWVKRNLIFGRISKIYQKKC